MGTVCNCCGTKIGTFDDYEHLRVKKESYLVCVKCHENIRRYQKGQFSLDEIIGPKCVQPIVDYFFECNADTEDNEKIREKIREKIENTTQEYSYVEAISSQTSSVGNAIKTVSTVLLVLCAIGSLIIMVQMENFILGVTVLLVSGLTCLLAYGIGEIVCLLKSIDSKLK